MSSFSTSLISLAHALRLKASRHLPVSLYITGVPLLGIAIAARKVKAPRRCTEAGTAPAGLVAAARRRVTLEKRAGASATGAARVMAAMVGDR